MSKHREFILRPIESILEEVPLALRNISPGLDTMGLYEYVMQSLFLKMTGFQEQKMKCICWELATDDYVYRYERYKKAPLGECSDLKEKNIVWGDLIEHVAKLEGHAVNIAEEEKLLIIDETKHVLEDFYKQTNMEGWAQREFHDYKMLISNCSKECLTFKTKKTMELFNHCENCVRRNSSGNDGSICKIGTLGEAYKALFEHRNRCAHNTLSYQHNLPSLQTLCKREYVFENYFLHFALLIMIDKMIICVFRHYLEVSNSDFSL